MTQPQIAKAERLAAEWQPNPAESGQYEVAEEQLNPALTLIATARPAEW